MFRRRWSGLPADPVFPANLKALGYFVNDDDEIRAIDDPNNYFKFFICKNERWNERQRFAMNEALGKVIHSRLEALGLQKLRLPLGAGPKDPHVPIFASNDLSSFDRVLVIFGEPAQDLGVIAYRVVNGRGGVDAGSMTSVARRANRSGPVGIVLANTGQLWWWPEGSRTLTNAGRNAVPMASAVHWGRLDDRKKNSVPENATVGEHVRCVFEQVLRPGVAQHVKLDVIAVGYAVDEVEVYLDDDLVWESWGANMNSLALLGGFYKGEHLQCDGFKTFMRERTRAYGIHDEPLNYPIAGPGPQGDPTTTTFTEFGCPIFSAGDATLTEMLLIELHPTVLEWMEEVALTKDYKNPHIEIAPRVPVNPEADGWGVDEEYLPTDEKAPTEGNRAGEEAKSEIKEAEGPGGGTASEGAATVGGPSLVKTEEIEAPELTEHLHSILDTVEQYATRRLEEGGNVSSDED